MDILNTSDIDSVVYQVFIFWHFTVVFVPQNVDITMDILNTSDIDIAVVYQVFIFWHFFPPVYCCLRPFVFVAFRGGAVIDGTYFGFIFFRYTSL
jgi:hypothetical protein